VNLVKEKKRRTAKAPVGARAARGHAVHHHGDVGRLEAAHVDFGVAESAKIYSCFLVFKPSQTETAKASIDNPTATSNRSSSPIGIPSFTGLSLCPIYNPFLCFFLFLNLHLVKVSDLGFTEQK